MVMSEITTRCPKQPLTLKGMGAVLAARTLHHPEFPLILIYSPKAGCSSLTKWFFYQTGLLAEASQYSSWIHRYRNDVLMTRPYRIESINLLNDSVLPVFKLVRNPFDRAVSSFIHMIRNAPPADPDRWESRLIKAARERAGKPLRDDPTLSFRDFLLHMSATGCFRLEVNGHVAQQYQAEEEGLISRILLLERFEEEVRRLEEEFRLESAPLDLLVQSWHHNEKRPPRRSSPAGSAADVDISQSQIRAGQQPSYEEMYDAETRQIVRTLYAEDFAAYGYES